MSSSTPTSIQPGWYEDPQMAGMLRWHDGVLWSPFTKSRTAPAQPTRVPRPRTEPAQPVSPSRPQPAAAMSPGLTPPARPVSPPAPAPSVATSWATAAAVPVPTAAPVLSAPATPPRVAPDSPPSGPRRIVGRLAERLPDWLPASVGEWLSLRMVRSATRTDRFRDRVTAAGLRRLLFPAETAWQASTAACLGIVTVALSVWPLAGLLSWVVTCGFAGLALRRLRREVLLGGAERAWFAVACGVGPLWTGLLSLTFR